MKIFITGFDGYVGQAAVAALQRKGASLTVLCRDSAAAGRASARGFAVCEMQLENSSGLADAVHGHDAVGHFAASDHPGFLPINRAAIKAMLRALPANGAFVMQGGTVVFGDQGRETPARQALFNAPPALTERAALDAWVLDQGGSNRRVYIVYGSFVFGGIGAMIPRALIEAAARSDVSAYPGDGDSIWSAVHVTDWADLIALALYAGPPGPQKIFAAAQEVRIVDAASLIGQALIQHKPALSVSITDARSRYPFFADALTLNQRFDGAYARDVLGWNPASHDLLHSFIETARGISL